MTGIETCPATGDRCEFTQLCSAQHAIANGDSRPVVDVSDQMPDLAREIDSHCSEARVGALAVVAERTSDDDLRVAAKTRRQEIINNREHFRNAESPRRPRRFAIA